MKSIIYTILFALLVCCGTATAEGSSGRGNRHRPLTETDMRELLAKGTAFEKANNNAGALECFNAVAMGYSDDMGHAEKQQCAEAFCASGNVYYRARQYAAAMNHYLEGLRISELNAFDLIAARIYIGIGNLYSTHGDYGMSIRYYKHALRLADKPEGRKIKNKVLNNLVGASCFMGKVAEGRKYLKALRQNREHTTEYEFNLLMCSGLVENCAGHTRQAILYYHRALACAGKTAQSDAMGESACACLAQIYLETNQPDSAIFYLRKNELTARRRHKPDLLEETMRSLSEAYAMKGDRREAAVCKMKHVDLSDSLYNNGEFNAMKNTMFIYEATKSEKAIQSLTREKQDRDKLITMQRGWILTLVAAFLLFVAMLIVLYKQKRQLYTAYRELYNRNRQQLENQSETGPETPKLLTAEQRASLLEAVLRVMADAEEFCNSDFSIDRLAALVGSNSRYVSEAINEGYGKNFRTFLNEYRIKEAMRRLADSEHYGGFTIKAISESVGYKSQANFITVFTKVTGMKPSIYQKISKE